MKHRVLCMVGGKSFYVDCYAINREQAIQVARSQYPNARIITTTTIRA